MHPGWAWFDDLPMAVIAGQPLRGGKQGPLGEKGMVEYVLLACMTPSGARRQAEAVALHVCHHASAI